MRVATGCPSRGFAAPGWHERAIRGAAGLEMPTRTARLATGMYRKPRFLEELHAIREEMSRECDYDVDLFAEMVRSGRKPTMGPAHNIRGRRVRAPGQAPEPGRGRRTKGKSDE